MSSTQSIKALGDQLRADLCTAYSRPVNDNLASGQPLRDAFSAFGRSAALSGISLEDTMAASADALQELFDRVGGGSSDPTTMLAAGIALAAGARAYQDGASEALSDVKEPAIPTQLSRLAALHRVNRAVTAHLELGEMLETTVRVVSDTTGADACALFLYDAATDSLALRAAVGLNAASVGAVTIRSGVGVTGRAAQERRSIAAPDAHVQEVMFAHNGTGDRVYASQLSVPMVLRGSDRLVGVLNILSIDRRDFDPSETAFLETIAGEVTVSIENARLYSQTDARLRRKVAELGTLQRVSRTVASTLDLTGVLRLIAEQAVELMNAEAAAIFRLPHKPGGPSGDANPVIEHFVGDEREVVNSARDRLVREVVRTGSSQAVDIDYTDGTGVVFCLPLRSARETLGALCLRLRPDAELTEDELGLLQAFSDSASLAIENAQLYQDARHGLETASALLQEMHHRVRNNLQTVAALLSLQLRTADDAPWATALREAISRIQAIAGIHDLLSDERRLGGTTVDVIAHHVIDDAHRTLIPPHLTVNFTVEPSHVTVPSRQATILALLINELISNAVSHGFEERSHGHIVVRSSQSNGLVTVEVENDGESVPAGFVPAESSGLGMKIVQRLVTSDLRGSFKIESPSDDGTIATITFPRMEESMESSSPVLEGAETS